MAQKGYIKNSVTADLGAPELAAIFKSIMPANGIINIFDDLECARINDNLVRLSPGVYNLSGYLLGVSQGTTADLAVDSGTAGYNRIDLLVAEFVRNGGGYGVDTLQFKIVKGTSTTGSPVDPTLTQQDINGTGVTRQEALYRLTITGTTLAAPVLLAGVVSVAPDYESISTNIKINGAQAVGARDTVARGDHVHPTDTSRVGQSPSTGTLINLLWSGTQAQYDAIGTKDANTLYFIV